MNLAIGGVSLISNNIFINYYLRRITMIKLYFISFGKVGLYFYSRNQALKVYENKKDKVTISFSSTFLADSFNNGYIPLKRNGVIYTAYNPAYYKERAF